MKGATYVCTLDYVERAVEADRRIRRGEHQHRCGTCMKWYWPLHPEEHEHAPVPDMYEAPSPKPRKLERRCSDCDRAERALEDAIASGRVVVQRRRRARQ